MNFSTKTIEMIAQGLAVAEVIANLTRRLAVGEISEQEFEREWSSVHEKVIGANQRWEAAAQHDEGA